MPFLDELTPQNKHLISKHPYKSTIIEDVSLYVETKGTESNENVIKQSLTNILLTMKGERLFNLSFGADLYSYIFENNINVSGLKSEIKNAISNYETRITIDTSNININANVDEHYLDIEIKYVITDSSEWQTWYDRLYL